MFSFKGKNFLATYFGYMAFKGTVFVLNVKYSPYRVQFGVLYLEMFPKGYNCFFSIDI